MQLLSFLCYELCYLTNICSGINSYVERLLERISNGVLAEDRRSAMTELQAVVAESKGAQLAFGAMGQCFVLL